MERYLDRGIDSAEDDDASAVVIQLNTPGGLVSSMEDIVERILSSEVPVIVYVSPSGAHAASAGTFITMAAHVAAMADATRIGAATPVDSSGQDIEGSLGDKVTNDLVALITGLAEQRGRNAEWAESAVREAAAVNEREALELNVIDLVAPNLESLLTEVDGHEVELPSGTIALSTAGAPTVSHDMNFVENVLDFLSDPNIAFILFNIGLIAILIELYSPGLIFPGVLGVVFVAIALFSFGTLPVNWLGVAFIGVAFVLLALEPFIDSHGLLSIGGIGFLIAGSLILTGGNSPDFRVSQWLIWSVIGVITACVALFFGILLKGRRHGPTTKEEDQLVGRVGHAYSPLTPYGRVYVAGEEWSAVAEGESIQQGEAIVVKSVEGLTLTVAKPELPAG
jgi:membrane-bound serine protease (ClpP class)